MIPEEMKYSKTHEWARFDAAASTVTAGITDFAVGQLGDVVYLELPAVSSNVTKGAPLGVIESVKAAVDLYSPVTGVVVEANASLPEALETLSRDPYGSAWMVKIKVSGADALSGLMTAQEYRAFVESEAGH